jgi:hypothetical protein
MPRTPYRRHIDDVDSFALRLRQACERRSLSSAGWRFRSARRPTPPGSRAVRGCPRYTSSRSSRPGSASMQTGSRRARRAATRRRLKRFEMPWRLANGRPTMAMTGKRRSSASSGASSAPSGLFPCRKSPALCGHGAPAGGTTHKIPGKPQLLRNISARLAGLAGGRLHPLRQRRRACTKSATRSSIPTTAQERS